MGSDDQITTSHPQAGRTRLFIYLVQRNMSAVFNTLGRSRTWRMLVDGTRDRKVFYAVAAAGSVGMCLVGTLVMNVTNKYGTTGEDLKKNRSYAEMHKGKTHGRAGVQRIFNQLPEGMAEQEATAQPSNPAPAPLRPAKPPSTARKVHPMQAVLNKPQQ